MTNISIASAERETGVTKDKLRMWERRYGFPQPYRDAQGDRCYDSQQIERLRLIKRLLDTGHRPSNVVGLDMTALSKLVASSRRQDLMDDNPSPDVLLDLLRTADLPGLRDWLAQRLATEGLVPLVREQLGLMNAAVGEAWARGQLTIAQEHLYTEEVTRLLRSGLQALPQPKERPQILLTTLPGEQHGLGLLMAEVLISAHGGGAINLGTEVPLSEIRQAARAHRCVAVALSFSAARGAQYVQQGVAALRAELDTNIALWIGGQGAQRYRADDPGVLVIKDLGSLGAAVSRLR